MSRREKLRERLRERPADATMRDVQTLLRQFDFVLARTRGSHHIFEYDDGERFRQLVVPVHGRKIKKLYVQQVIVMLDELFPPGEATDEEES
ncbi:MAG: type II toxin-antitoxin system HicA family toxin [Anaerolineae bacterium]|nr:type II toxin-antitoxin system HicA family toxin [Anaerolineae bacterium]